MTPRDFIKLDFKNSFFQKSQDFDKIVAVSHLQRWESEPGVGTVGIYVKIVRVNVDNSLFEYYLTIGKLVKG